MASLDDRIDALYQLPPGEFTAARTALAKSLSGAEAAAVKALKKPASVPWAVNQLYWRDRKTFQHLMDAGRALRSAQVAAIEGRRADVRKAAEMHRAAVSAAASRAAALARDARISAAPEPLARMLEAISLAKDAPARPGRFTEVLHPAAFEALAGVVPGHKHAASHHPGNAKSDDDERNARKREQEERARTDALEAAMKKAQQNLERAQEVERSARAALDEAEERVREAKEALRLHFKGSRPSGSGPNIR